MVAIHKIGIKYNKNNEEEYNISITCYFYGMQITTL